MIRRSCFSVLLSAFILAGSLLLTLSACGKKGSPEAPGPANLITYPRAYPTE